MAEKNGVLGENRTPALSVANGSCALAYPSGEMMVLKRTLGVLNGE
jgi:hypothetical protein